MPLDVRSGVAAYAGARTAPLGSRSASSGGSATKERSVPRRAFLVEDNLLIRVMMTEALEDIAGIKVVGTAESESDAIQAMREVEWEVALVDLFLVAGSGLGVAYAFKQRMASQRLYIVTNYATPDIRE